MQDSAQTTAGKAAITTELLVQHIRDRILRRVYAPGQRLVERQLAEEFGASRTMIRDAFAILAERRLILRTQNRGAEVVRLGLREIEELFQVREVIEGLLVRLAALAAAPGAWDELGALFNGPAVAAVRQHDIDGYLAMLDRLTTEILSIANNAVLSEIQSGLNDRCAVIAYRVQFLPGRMEASLLGHQRILAALAAQQADLAEQLKRDNINGARMALLAYPDIWL